MKSTSSPITTAGALAAATCLLAAACAAVIWPGARPEPRETLLLEPATARPGRLQVLSLAAPERPRAHALSVPATEEVWEDRHLDLVWVHPLAVNRRLPENPSRRFGAPRPGKRNRECRSGHCGVDIGTRRGEIVHASADGVVTRVERSRHKSSGRYIRIEHATGFSTYYMHMDRVRRDIEVGTELRAGEPIGTLGRTGIQNSGAHLHFGVSRKVGSRERFLDPEPMLRQAVVLESPAPFGYRKNDAL